MIRFIENARLVSKKLDVSVVKVSDEKYVACWIGLCQDMASGIASLADVSLQLCAPSLPIRQWLHPESV